MMAATPVIPEEGLAVLAVLAVLAAQEVLAAVLAVLVAVLVMLVVAAVAEEREALSMAIPIRRRILIRRFPKKTRIN